MFRHVGKKIKTLASVLYYISLCLYLLSAIVAAGMFFLEEEYLLGIVILIPGIGLGILISWLSTVLLYGFGELIDQSMQTNDLLRQSLMAQHMQNPNPDQNQGPMPGGFYPNMGAPMAPPVQPMQPPMNQGYANMTPPPVQPWMHNQNQ